MRHIWVPLVAVLGLAGCDSMNKVKSENPVFPPAPPRLSLSNDGLRGKIFGKSDEKPGTVSIASSDPGDSAIQTASASEKDAVGPLKLDGSEVVATVNGQPIFASEVLDRYSVQLSQAKQQAPPEEFKKIREMLIRRDLPAHVERRILIQNLRATLKAEQIKMLQGHLDTMFEEEMDRLKKQLKVETRAELEAELTKQGTSLESLKTSFTNQRMAMEYLFAKSKYDKKIGRRELMDYYQAHEKDYSFPDKVKWQQIVVDFGKHGGKEKAYNTVLKKAIDELSSGTDFETVARKYSDGASRNEGGNWDWMQRGSLDDEALEEALFTMPIGKVSEVFVGKKSFQIVKVVNRKLAGVKPFEELQEEIRDKVELDLRKAASQKLLKEIKEKAVVDSPYLDASKKEKS